MSEVDQLLKEFVDLGGKFNNAALSYNKESGFYLHAVDKDKESEVFCPSNLLINVDDISINKNGLFIADTNKYGEGTKFLNKYLKLHFGRKLVSRFMEEMKQINALTEEEALVLKEVGLPVVQPYSGTDEDKIMEYVKSRMFHIHCLKKNDKKVLMPVVTFINHDKDGKTFTVNDDGISVSGKFTGEIYAMYNMNDALQMYSIYGFVNDSRFSYSLPLQLKLPRGGEIVVNRNYQKSHIDSTRFRWPVIKKEGSTTIVSWFPLYYERGPRYPVRVARRISEQCGFPSDLIVYRIFRFNINKLLSASMKLKTSKNAFAQSAAQAIERQLELICGLREGENS